MIISKKLIFSSFAVGIVVGLISCGGIWAFRFLNGPVAAGAAMVDPNKDDVATKAHPHLLQGIAVQLSYPEQFDLVSRLASDKNATEQYNLGDSSKTQLVAAISVHPLETGNLEDSASWRSREIDVAHYTPNREQLQNESISIMTKKDGTEKTLFWVHKGQLLIVALSTNDTNDDLPALLAMIKPTIKWRSV
jgi:hypothetical protein